MTPDVIAERSRSATRVAGGPAILTPAEWQAGHDVDERAYPGWVANPLTLSYTIDDLEWLRLVPR